MSAENGNGNVKQLLYWLLGLCSSVIIGTLTVWLSAIHSELTSLRAAISMETPRLAVVESVLANLTERLREFERKRDEERNRSSHIPGQRTERD